MKKTLWTVLLATTMLLLLVACGKKAGNTGTGSIKDGFVLRTEESVELGEPSNKLDPQTVYSKLTYTPEMFYGEYRISGGDEAEEKFGAETSYFKTKLKGQEAEVSELPFQICAGKYSLAHKVNYIEEYNWMQAYYMQKDKNGNPYLTTALCAYEVEGNKLTLKPLSTFNVDDKTNKITYTFDDVTWEYTFAFDGRNLKLSTENSSVTLTTGLDPYGKTDYFHVDGYLSPGSKSAVGIDQIEFRYDAEDGDSRIYFETIDGESSYNSIGVLQENGLFTFTLSLENSKKTYQFVYFYCGDDGIILTDGTDVYYYNDDYWTRNKTELNKYLTEDQTGKLEALSESELKAIVEKKENLMEDLAKAFNDAGIKVSVDKKTGELAMDSSVLFGGDSAALTDDGKKFLNKFVEVYTSIVFSDKYQGFVSKTMVEGHTAPVAGGTYESGLPLSQERANNVKNYCVSSETGVDTSKLAANLEAVGYSNSKPVTDANGEVDMAASRRVSFRFVINLD